MKAEKKYIVNKNRTKLEEVLPLTTPYSMFVDVCNACNFKCKFCAIQTSNRELHFKKQVMDIELYKKIIDDISEFEEPLKMLRLTANGEPLLNKDLPEMISYARKKRISEHIEIVTNASLLRPDIGKRLIDAGLNRIRISIEAIDPEEYYKMAQVKIDWEEFKNNIRYFYNNRKQCEVYIKTVDAAVDTEEKQKRFYEEFGDMCDKISVERVIPIWTGYDEIYKDFDIDKKNGLHGDRIRRVECCPFPFYSFVINPDGQATVCCSDWERKTVVGDANIQSVKEIWNGKQYRNFLMGMLKNGRTQNHEACRVCAYPCYDAVDDIDPYRQKILEKYKNVTRKKETL